jgi:hypothetical protein
MRSLDIHILDLDPISTLQRTNLRALAFAVLALRGCVDFVACHTLLGLGILMHKQDNAADKNSD